jgi:hypothetical protein
MKKLLMTLGIVLGFTAVVSAQSSEAKSSEALASKPDTKEKPSKNVELSKPVVTTVKVVTSSKAVNKETTQKVVIAPVSNKPRSATVVDTDVQFKENKTKGKN